MNRLGWGACSFIALAVCLGPGAMAAAVVATVVSGRDATLYQSGDGSVANGAGQHLFVGTNSNMNVRRGLIWFDVAGALPAGAIVTDATLTLHVSSAASDTATSIAVHRVTRHWTEGASDPGGSEGRGATAGADDATWLHASYEDELWSTPGGDFVGGASGSSLVGDVGPATWAAAGLAADVQAWLADPGLNFGWILVGDEAGASTARRFDTREHPTAAVRPSLEIRYAIPSPGPGAAMLIATMAALRRRRG